MDNGSKQGGPPQIGKIQFQPTMQQRMGRHSCLPIGLVRSPPDAPPGPSNILHRSPERKLRDMWGTLSSGNRFRSRISSLSLVPNSPPMGSARKTKCILSLIQVLNSVFTRSILTSLTRFTSSPVSSRISRAVPSSTVSFGRIRPDGSVQSAGPLRVSEECFRTSTTRFPDPTTIPTPSPLQGS